MKFHTGSFGIELASVKFDEVVVAMVAGATFSGHSGNVNNESQSRPWKASFMLVEPWPDRKVAFMNSKDVSKSNPLNSIAPLSSVAGVLLPDGVGKMLAAVFVFMF